ncbi:TetR/AcrR family transcriptional regulator [Dactylosporangium sp. NPDC005572]|uniref:TetR/AcrR family transcriptional regulator n=1 Tax=Dactylosporangium sp. NPDC005572 TaxID=3156889 RepID=UPI0033A41167
MRTWAATDPKAGLMTRKRDAIVVAALEAFLREGYSGSSVNRIAAGAGVSIATLYRHFDSKDDLFIAVIRKACSTPDREADPDWLRMPPLQGLTRAGSDLLRNILSEQQLALFRVVTLEAHRFPELGRRYQQEIIGERVVLFTRHLASWPAALRVKIKNPTRAAHVFSALVQADLVETALLGGPIPDPLVIQKRARQAASDLLALAESGRL